MPVAALVALGYEESGVTLCIYGVDIYYCTY